MLLKSWDKLPDSFKTDEVLKYYNILKKKAFSLILKRAFDIVASIILIVLLSPFMLIISILIKCDSKGSVFFTQERITAYGKKFKIIKFRTMVKDADKAEVLITVNNDSRITKVGRVLRRYRLDEIPQLFNILTGDMTFVSTRPEVNKYVKKYKNEMLATLLIPAGVTSAACIKYKSEEKLISENEDVDDTYINNILPDKMKCNLEYLENFNFWLDIKLMIGTVFAVAKKENKEVYKCPEKVKVEQ